MKTATDDLDLMEKVHASLAAPVTRDEAARRRRSLIGNALITIAIGSGGEVYSQARYAHSWRDATFFALLISVPVLLHLRQLAVEYAVARPRPGTPMPEDILDFTLRHSALCPHCRALVRRGGATCAQCGGGQPGVHPAVFGAVVFAGLLFLVWIWYAIMIRGV